MTRRRLSPVSGYVMCAEHGCPSLGPYMGRCGTHYRAWRDHDDQEPQLALDLGGAP